jgi:hypothetical protein
MDKFSFSTFLLTCPNFYSQKNGKYKSFMTIFAC